jgi:hypothetical protein
MESEWFVDLLQSYLKPKGRGGARELAKVLGVDQSQITRWLSGVDPQLSSAVTIIKLLGGDITRALPDWEPSETVERPMMPVYGTVAAGAVDWNEDGRKRKEVTAWPDLWKNSRYWPLTNPVQTVKGIQPVILLEITGNSMEPEYRSGEIIACRTPKNVDDLPEGTPCIIRDADGQTFKLLRRSIDGSVIGDPINKSHRVIVFKKTREVSVPLVVVGKLDPGAGGKASINNIPGVRKGF